MGLIQSIRPVDRQSIEKTPFLVQDALSNDIRNTKKYEYNELAKTDELMILNQVDNIDLRLIRNLNEVEGIWMKFQETAWYTPFQDFQWIESWYQSKTRKTDIRPAIVLGFVDNELLFILPLSIERVFGINRLTWLAGEVNDYNCPLVLPELLSKMTLNDVKEIWVRIAFLIKNIDAFHFTKQPEFLGNMRNPFIADGAVQGSCSSYLFLLKKDWKTLYRQLRSVKSQKRVRQKENKLKRHGRLCFKSPANLSERNRAITTILNWKSDQLDHRGDRNPFVDDASNGFGCSSLKQTIENCAKIGSNHFSLRIYGLYLDDRLIAGIIAFVSQKTFFLFTTSYDPKVFPNCSPGMILLIKTFELSARAGLHTYDFLAGDENYKIDWCDQELILYDSFFGVTAMGRLDAAANYQKLALKKIMRSNPQTMALLRKVNRFARQTQVGLVARLRHH